jgi:transcriptional regulator with XRE-family HTH domain
MTEQSGGGQLRTLRKTRKKSIDNIAIEAGITYKTLSDIERGITKQPAREVLQQILDALHRTSPLAVENQQEIMYAFGYQRPYPIPSQIEVAQAKIYWVELYDDQIPYPAYLGDIAQRLLAWNSAALRLFGFTRTDPRLEMIENITIFDLGFGLAPQLAPVLNKDEFFPELIRTMKAEFYPYRNEEWYHDCIQSVQEKYPYFDTLWRAVDEEEIKKTMMGNVVPIMIDVPEAGPLTFRLTRIPFANDPRFFISQWLPVDGKTMAVCADWRKQVGAEN